jgi:hypothetical protein
MVEFKWNGLATPLGAVTVHAPMLEDSFAKKAIFEFIGLDWHPVFEVGLKRLFGR